LNAISKTIATVVATVAVIGGCFVRVRAETPTSRVVGTANAFLSTLDDSQRQRLVYSFDDSAQRARWSNFPTGVVPRGGIALKDMTAQQQAAAMNLLATVLSPQGLEKVQEIREADDDFKANGSQRGPRGRGPGPGAQGGPGSQGGPPAAGPPPQFGRGGPGGPGDRGPGGRSAGGNAMFGSDLYYISFLGAPSLTNPWMLQFGGHHLALNITIAGTKGVMTPSLTGAQPATFPLNGKTIRPLGRESDKGYALLESLSDDQRKQAILSYRVADLVVGPGQDGKKIAPEGLKASAMNDKQRAALLDLIGEWSDILNETSAKARMAQMKADLDETWFAWSGPTTSQPGANITAYYRIQGPHLVIEYAPQSDEPANHVHTIYRDPTNDYGSELISK
jgi:Protein of unknown function (DUF3500)